MEYKTLVGQLTKNQRSTIEYIKWNPPIPGYKLNTDGSYSSKSKKEGTGEEFRDCKRDWVLGYSGYALESNNIKSELLALIQVLKLAVTRNLTPIEINVDCQDLISLIFNNISSKYNNMLIDCRDLLHQLWNPPIEHSYRETNSVADAQAKEGANMYICSPLTILEDPPCFVQRKLAADKEGTSFVRIKRQSVDTKPSTYNVCTNFFNSAPTESTPNSAVNLLVLCNDAY